MDGVDTTRLESFRQLRKEIRGSNEHLIVGIDVAKDNHHAFFGTARGETLLKRLVFNNNLQGYEKLYTYVEATKVKNNLNKVVFGLEPTANYHKPLGEHLIKCGFDVVLVAGTAVKRNRELLDGRWDKHDTKDAANVADLVSQGKCLFYEYPIMLLRELRNLLSFKRRLKKQEHGARVRIRNHLLAQYFPELDPYFSRMSACSLSVVKWCLEPSLIAGLEYEEFLRLVAPGKRTIKQREHVKLIWEKAFESIGCNAGETVQFEAKMMVEELQHVRESISEVEEKIEEICLNFPEYTYLLTMPGFGKDISSKVLGAIGNPFRFDNAKQVIKLSGWDLNANRSGKSSGYATAVISKKGKADLRYALYQAALVASSRNQLFVAYFTEKLRQRSREKGIKTKMRVKLAAKLLVIAWTLMKKGEPFNPEYLKVTLQATNISQATSLRNGQYETAGVQMEELERFKKEISLMEYAPTYDYTELDRNQSSRTCVVLRRQADDGKIAVSRGHDGHWVYYDFRRGKGGSILDFVMQHTGCNLGQTRKELRKMLCCNIDSFSHTAPLPNPRSATKDRQKAAWEYADTTPITKHHDYLESRGIGLESILAGRFSGAVRVDWYRNACFPYFDFEGIAGIEKRNHNFKCYTKGGRKGLWRSTLKEGDVRAVICEAPIDALSYAKLRRDKNDRTRYFAIGGQVSIFQWKLIDGLIKKYSSEKMDMFLAFDNDPAGKGYIRQFQERYSGVLFTLDLPPQEGQDWNDVLQSNQSMKMKAVAPL